MLQFKKNSWLYQPKSVFAFLLLAYCGVGAYLLQFYLYQTNPDGISYISIAQKYLHGDFANAINGYWGPLYSWLLAPFLAIVKFPLLATKILSLLIGFATLIGVRLLSKRFDLTERSRNILLLSLIPIILFFAFCLISPDLLVVCILVYYFAIIFDRNYKTDSQKGLLCGMAGGFAYLAKSYGLPFFLAHFLIFNGIYFLSSRAGAEKRTVLRNLFSGLVLFSLISGSWIVLISKKYERFTFSTSAMYHTSAAKPKSPLDTFQLIPPPNETAINYWEDPSFDLFKIDNEVQLKSKSDAKAQPQTEAKSNVRAYSTAFPQFSIPNMLGGLYKNFASIISTFQAFSEFSIVVLLGALLLCLPFNRKKIPHSVFYALLTLAIYSAGYMLTLVEKRYLWIAYVMLVIIGISLFDFFLELKKSKLYKAVLSAILVGFLYSYWQEPLHYLTNKKGVGKGLYEYCQDLKNNHALQGNIASDVNWPVTLIMAFYNDYKYYGMTGLGRQPDNLQNILRENNIAYFFSWNPEFQPLTDFKKILDDEAWSLRVYLLPGTSR